MNVSAITLQRESFVSFFADAMPLLEKHYEEIARYKDIPLSVDVEQYKLACDRDALRVYTVRSEGKLIGYALFAVATNSHYSTSLQARQDVIYLDHAWRGGTMGMKLVRYTDEQLRKDGVQLVLHHQKIAHPALGRLLEHEGYEAVEKLWMKRLDLQEG